jgi:cation:H+ antiporter
MVLASLAILVGLALLWAGAEGLVRGSASMALRLGLTPLVVGLTVVAFGTSSPELVVSVGAALEGQGAIALGNVVGSNVGNVGLILGLGAIVSPIVIRSQIVRLDMPIMVGCAILLVVLLADGEIGRLEGAGLFAGIVAYTLFSLRLAKRSSDDPLGAEIDAELPPESGSLRRDVLLSIAGFALLLIGAKLLVEGAIVVARAAGLSEAVIGLTIVAVGTSLPELASTLVASAKGEADLAVGNVVGSNVFNVLAVLGAAALAHPLDGAGVRGLDLGVMILFSIVVLPLARTGFRLERWEGGVLLAAYVAYVVSLLAGF